MAGLFMPKTFAIRDTVDLQGIEGVHDFYNSYTDQMMASMRDIQYDNSTVIPHQLPREFQMFDFFDTRSPQERAEDLRRDNETGQIYMTTHRLFQDLPEQIRPKNYSVVQHGLSKHVDHYQQYHDSRLGRTVDEIVGPSAGPAVGPMSGRSSSGSTSTGYTPQQIAPAAAFYDTTSAPFAPSYYSSHNKNEPFVAEYTRPVQSSFSVFQGGDGNSGRQIGIGGVPNPFDFTDTSFTHVPYYPSRVLDKAGDRLSAYGAQIGDQFSPVTSSAFGSAVGSTIGSTTSYITSTPILPPPSYAAENIHSLASGLDDVLSMEYTGGGYYPPVQYRR